MADEFQAETDSERPSTEVELRATASGKRRACECRYPVDDRATVHLLSLASRVTGRLVDISLNGCHIRTDNRFPLGIFRRVEAEFCVDGLPFRLGGVTQAIYDPFNVGIRFLDLSDRKREQLLQLVEEIKEHNAPTLASDSESEETRTSDTII